MHNCDRTISPHRETDSAVIPANIVLDGVNQWVANSSKPDLAFLGCLTIERQESRLSNNRRSDFISIIERCTEPTAKLAVRDERVLFSASGVQVVTPAELISDHTIVAAFFARVSKMQPLNKPLLQILSKMRRLYVICLQRIDELFLASAVLFDSVERILRTNTLELAFNRSLVPSESCGSSRDSVRAIIYKIRPT